MAQSAWFIHVAKTRSEMKKSGKKFKPTDVFREAAKTYKKSSVTSSKKHGKSKKNGKTRKVKKAKKGKKVKKGGAGEEADAPAGEDAPAAMAE